MEQQLTATGDTTSIKLEKPTMMGHINEDGELFACVDEIFHSEYDEDMNSYKFTIHTYSGEAIVLCLIESQIKEMSLFVRKAQAEENYYKHITNN